MEHGGGHSVGQHIHWQIGQWVVNGDTIMMTWIVMAILLIIGFLAARSVSQRIPSGMQNVIEIIIEAFHKQMEDALGAKAKRFAPLIISLFLFLLISNWLGLIPGLTSPTNDLNTTLGLALLVVTIVHLSGIRDKGLGYFAHYLKPYAFFLPIHMVEELAKPITLAFRLFGNILAGELLIGILLVLVPKWMPVPNVVWLGFSVFVGVIQAFIFTMLTLSYISSAVSEEHHD
jgi:F-type H+-transporting ATPase subunit a